MVERKSGESVILLVKNTGVARIFSSLEAGANTAEAIGFSKIEVRLK